MRKFSLLFPTKYLMMPLVVTAALICMTSVHAYEGCADDPNNSAIQALCTMQDGMSVVKIDHQWGAIDANGNIAVEPMFRELDNFSEGLAVAKGDEGYGFVDKKGNWVIQPQFTDADSFSEGLAGVRINGKTGFIDRNGKWVVEPKYSYVGSFHQGVATATIIEQGSSITRLINQSGDVIKVFPVNANVSSDPNAEGFYKVRLKRGKELTNIDGRHQALKKSLSSYSYGDGLFVTRQADWEERAGMYGAVDLQENSVIPPVFKSLEPFHGGLAIASEKQLTSAAIASGKPEDGQRLGLIDKQGNFVVEPIYKRIERIKDSSGGGGFKAYRTDSYNSQFDLLDAAGNQEVTFTCKDKVTELNVSYENGWKVYNGCGKIWVFHRSKLVFNSALDFIGSMQTTSRHLLLEAKSEEIGDPEFKYQFRLINTEGKVVLSEKDVELNSPYDGVELIASNGSASEDTPHLPIAWVDHGYNKTIDIVTDTYKVVTNPAWQYDSAMNDLRYQRDNENIEGPLPIKTEEGWGAVDENGQWVIKPQFSRLTTFKHGLAFALQSDRKEYVVDRKGRTYPLPEGRRLKRVEPFVLVGDGLERGQLIRFNVKTSELNVVVLPKEVGDLSYSDFHNGLAKAYKDGLWGLINTKGEWQVEPIYQGIEAVQLELFEGDLVGWKVYKTVDYSISERDQLYGWLDKNGKEVIPADYTSITFDRQNHVLQIEDGSGFEGLMTLSGETIIKPECEDVTAMKDGWFSCQLRDKEGLVDSRGKWVAQPTIDAYRFEKETHIAVYNRRKVRGLVDMRGRISTEAKPLTLTPDISSTWWHEPVKNDHGQKESVFYGFDFKERLRIPGLVDEYSHFSEGVISFTPHEDANASDQQGLINDQGKVLGLYDALSIQDMENGFAVFSQRVKQLGELTDEELLAIRVGEQGLESKDGYINQAGEVAMAARFDDASNFSEERAVVLLKGNLGLINTKGELMLHSGWLCGRTPVILDGKERVVWPKEARTIKQCGKK